VTLGSGGDNGTEMNATSGSFVRESQTNRYPAGKGNHKKSTALLTEVNDLISRIGKICGVSSPLHLCPAGVQSAGLFFDII
jgi:hypothetical protein